MPPRSAEPRNGPPDPRPGPTATAELAARLRAEIIAGERRPGSPLREEELAATHALSRHTVRSALAALAAEGLLTLAPYRGARVIELDDDALLALQELRGALESEAVRMLRDRHGDRWPAAVTAPLDTALEALAEAEASGDWLATTRAHAAVHQSLVAAAGSIRITEAYARLDAEILVLLTHARPDYPAGTLTAEHREYLDAVQRTGGDAVRAHLAHSTEAIRAARSAAGKAGANPQHQDTDERVR